MIHPQGTYDTQAAWTGSWETNPKDLIRVETAAYLGQPIFFRIIGPWTRPEEHRPGPRECFPSLLFSSF